MSHYTIAFDVNGTVHEIDGKSVKIGNMFLHVNGRVNGDDQVVGMIPFESVCYVAHDSVTVSLDDLPSGEDADPATVMRAVENKAAQQE